MFGGHKIANLYRNYNTIFLPGYLMIAPGAVDWFSPIPCQKV
ncbi:hypothetical protein ADICYQ_5474 [Cyclobacterium qasimii M12-11B]|uniref:Uncharacterized protein n=1 Tax=Cyclobacterium qasimii M12-11B TaxID=641524 RepID=S7WMY0_9BACT|nr:hypothetical protein ADICYQ_5474 [Cyclobacterium qasimii M12-11B]